MENHAQKAKELFLQGYNCSQAVLVAFSDIIGLSEQTAFKISSSFGGGMGRLRQVCGAVSAIFMAAGLIYSEDKLGGDKDKQYAIVRALAKEFEEQNGSLICDTLLKNAELVVEKGGKSQKRTKEYYQTRPCADLVYNAAQILDKFIENNPPKTIT